MLFAQAREESALRCWNCCSYMSFVLVSNYMYLRNHKFKGFAVACDVFWQRCVPPLFLSWLRNTVSLLNLFWKCMGMKQEALLRLYGWHSAKRRLFCAELLRRAPASGRNRSPACFSFFFLQEVPERRCCDGQCELAVWLGLNAISSGATLGEEEVRRAHTPAVIQGSISARCDTHIMAGAIVVT